MTDPEARTLFDHQKTFVENSKCRTRIVLAHEVGAGKTFTALNVINEIKNKNNNLQTVIGCPATLIETWTNEIDLENQIGNNYRVFAHENLETQLNKLNNYESIILVIDESHLLINSSIDDNAFLFKLKNKVHSLILLTATPMVRSVLDLAFLYNMVCEEKDKSAVPKDPIFFRNKFTTDIKRVRRLLILSNFLNAPGVSNALANVLLSLATGVFPDKPTVALLIAALFSLRKEIQQTNGAYKMNDDWKLRSFARVAETGSFISILKKKMEENARAQPQKKVASRPILKASVFPMAFGMIVMTLYAINAVVDFYISQQTYPGERDMFITRSVKNEELSKALSTYFDFSNISSNVEFPIRHITVMRVPFTVHQMKKWTEFAMEAAAAAAQTSDSDKSAKEDAIINKFKKFGLEEDTNSQNIYEVYGRALSLLMDKESELPPKIEELVKHIIDSTNKTKNYTVPHRFVIYSSFTWCLNKIKDELTKNNVEVLELLNTKKDLLKRKDVDSDNIIKDYNDYKNNPKVVLLLHSNWKEGITLKRTDEMHIMEPLLTFADYVQVMGRVARLYTHCDDKDVKCRTVEETPSSTDQHVSIITWVSTVNLFFLKNFSQRAHLISNKAQFYAETKVRPVLSISKNILSMVFDSLGKILKNLLSPDKLKQEFYNAAEAGMKETKKAAHFGIKYYSGEKLSEQAIGPTPDEMIYTRNKGMFELYNVLCSKTRLKDCDKKQGGRLTRDRCKKKNSLPRRPTFTRVRCKFPKPMPQVACGVQRSRRKRGRAQPKNV